MPMPTESKAARSASHSVPFGIRSACRTALLKVLKRLKRRPEPRWPWDAVASDGLNARNLFLLVPMLRAALAAARLEGPDAFEETRGAVAVFFATQEAVVLDGFDLPTPTCRMQLAADGIEENSEASTALAQFAANPCSQTQARAMEEAAEAAQTMRHTMSVLSRYQPQSA